MMGAIELRSIDDLKPAEYNPRAITDGAALGLQASLERFGDISGIVWSERTGNLVCGHQRVQQLRKLGAQLVRTSDGCVELRAGSDGKRFAVRVVSWDDATEKAANVTANNAHIAGSFNDGIDDLLREICGSIGHEDSATLQLDSLLAEVNAASGKETGEIIEDDVPEPPKVPVTKVGDLWILGEHRLLCGDSTNRADVSRLLGERKPFIMVTDPPYGVGYDCSWRDKISKEQRSVSKRIGKVKNDDRDEWLDAYNLFPGDVAYIWHAALHSSVVFSGLHSASFIVRSQIIWAKQMHILSRGHYHWQHEPCWYAVRDNATSRWAAGRDQTTVWRIQGRIGAIQGNSDDTDTTHGTQKPVECMARPIRNHGGSDDDVYDPFLGSGTTIIAAEQLNRRAYGLEIEPAYCDMAIERWEKLTGRKAIKG